MQPILVHDLHNLPVITQGGTKIGALKDVAIDVDSGRVIHYVVKRGLIARDELLVASDEVIEIRFDAMIVKDTFVFASDRVPA